MLTSDEKIDTEKGTALDCRYIEQARKAVAKLDKLSRRKIIQMRSDPDPLHRKTALNFSLIFVPRQLLSLAYGQSSVCIL